MKLLGTSFLMQLFFKDIIWKVNTNKKEIYLTFDDGPHPEITPWVLNELDKYKAKATFFCLGKNIEQFPNVFSEIIAKGHCIGNHSYDHVHGWKYSFKSYISNVDRCEKLTSSKFFRPPHGRMKPTQVNYLKKRYTIVMWDVIGRDYDNTITKEQCLESIINTTKPGSIVLLHDNEKSKESMQYALPRLLEYFSLKGFQFKELNTECIK